MMMVKGIEGDIGISKVHTTLGICQECPCHRQPNGDCVDLAMAYYTNVLVLHRHAFGKLWTQAGSLKSQALATSDEHGLLSTSLGASSESQCSRPSNRPW